MKLNTLNIYVFLALFMSVQAYADTKEDPKVTLLSKENAQIKAKVDDISATNESLVETKRQVSDLRNLVDQYESDSDKAQAKLERQENLERESPDTIPEEVIKKTKDENKNAKKALAKANDDLSAAVAKQNALKSKQTEQYDQFQLLRNDFERDVDAAVTESLDQKIRTMQTDKTVEVTVRTSCSDDESQKLCKEKSLKSAELGASEKGSTVFLSSLTEVKNFKLSKEEVRSEVQATLSDETSTQKRIATDDSVIIETTLKAKVRPAISDSLRDQLMENIRAGIYASAGGRVDYDKVQKPTDDDEVAAVPKSKPKKRVDTREDRRAARAEQDRRKAEEAARAEEEARSRRERLAEEARRRQEEKDAADAEAAAASSAARRRSAVPVITF